MPAYTRSSVALSASPKSSARVNYNMNGERWTQQEERDLIRMFRHEKASVMDVAKALHRNPMAVHYRVDKVLNEHMEGGVSLMEASAWLHPHISAREMSEDFANHIATFSA
jgi:hypothetical protein